MDADGNEINKWVVGTETVNVTAKSDIAGVSSEWTFDIMPDNASLGNTADASIKFKVNQNLPKGTILTIKAPTNLSLISTTDIQDLCWSKISYVTCKVNGGKIELDLAQDVTSLS